MKNTNAILAVCTVVMFGVAMAAVVAIAVAVPEGANPGSMIVILLGSLATSLATLATLLKGDKTHEVVKEVKAQTDDLTNGLMDAKLIAALVKVLPAHMLDVEPEVVEAAQARVDQAAGH